MRGRALEGAIHRALRHYEKAGRVGDAEKKQLKRLWNGKIIGGAAIDFKCIAWGYGDNQENVGLAIEAKEISGHDLPFGEGGIRQTQFDALNEYVSRPGDRRAFVVVDVKATGEVYRLDWAVVQREYMRPIIADVAGMGQATGAWESWRKSIDLKFLRGFGELLKVSGDGDKRCVWVLDGSPHPLKAGAALGVIAERAGKPRVELFADAEAKVVTVPRQTKEERLQGVRNAIAAYRPKRKGLWGK